MKDILYWLGGAGAWLITLWMAKRFIESEILTPIKDLKEVTETIRKEFNSQYFRITELFTHSATLANRAHEASEESLKEVQAIKESLKPKRDYRFNGKGPFK